MRVTAKVTSVNGKYQAKCMEVAAQGEGATVAAAVRSLREALADRVAPEGISLPSRPSLPTIEIDLVEGDAEERAIEPTGPGD